MITRNIVEFSKDNVLKAIKTNTEERIKRLNTFVKPQYKGDIRPEIAKKIWHLMNNGNTTAYSLFKDMNCYHPGTLEHWENLSSFLGNLVDDSYFGIEYAPDLRSRDDEIELQEDFNKILIDQGQPTRPVQPSIHLSHFKMVWAFDEHPAIIHESEMSSFLDWFINYSDNEFIYDEHGDCKKGPTGKLSLIKDNWEDYPKQIKQAYDAWYTNYMLTVHSVVILKDTK